MKSVAEYSPYPVGIFGEHGDNVYRNTASGLLLPGIGLLGVDGRRVSTSATAGQRHARYVRRVWAGLEEGGRLVTQSGKWGRSDALVFGRGVAVRGGHRVIMSTSIEQGLWARVAEQMGHFPAHAQHPGEDVERLVADSARDLLGAEFVVLTLAEGKGYRQVISASSAGASVHAAAEFHASWTSPIRAALSRTAPLRILEVQASAEHRGMLDRFPGARNYLGVRILEEGKIMGALGWINWASDVRFHDQEERVTQVFAEFAGRALAQESQLATAAAFKAIVEEGLDAVFVVDSNGVVEYANAAFRDRYESTDEVVGTRLGAMAFSDAKRDSMAIIESPGKPDRWRGDLRTTGVGGVIRENESSITTLRRRDGTIEREVRVDHDLTAEHRLEIKVLRETGLLEAVRNTVLALEPAGELVDVANAACASLVLLPSVGSSVVLSLTPRSFTILATAGRIAEHLEIGQTIEGLAARYMNARMSSGPYLGPWATIKDGDDFSKVLQRSGISLVAMAPITANEQLVGALAIASHDGESGDDLAALLPGVSTLGAALSNVVGPKILARDEVVATREVVDWYIEGRRITPFFQPIANLLDGSVIGWEALARLRRDQSPEWLLGRADEAGCRAELEIAAIEAALREPTHGRAGYLSLNVSLHGLFADRLLGILADAKREIVLELTEHIEVADYDEVRERLRLAGRYAKLAIDDAGAGHSSMRHILELQPEIVKLDMSVVRGIDHDVMRQALVSGMVHFVSSFGGTLVAEGIETSRELMVLRSLGVQHGQGFLLGKPRRARKDRRWPTSIRLPAERHDQKPTSDLRDPYELQS